MSFGKSGGTNTVVPTLSPEQNAMIAAQTGLFTGTVGPAYQSAVKGATDIYNLGAPGVTSAAQNLAGTSMQAQNVLGQTGEAALRTGISGLQNLFTPEYEQQQMLAALMPAQAQYQQNLANQTMGFGGAGQIGSARQAFAQSQLAGATQMAQMQAAADVQKNIQAQRAAAAQALVGAGQGGIGQAIGAAGTGVTAAMTPQQLYNQYASVLFGTPAASYVPNFAGTQGRIETGNKTSFGISI
jgi:hypothetical protein